MANNPYQVLGLNPGASKKEVKSAYRRLCRQYHPDRNPDDQQASERLQRIMAAYQQITSGDSSSPGTTDRVGSFPDLNAASRVQELAVSFSQAFTGVQKTITVYRQALCRSCGGSGAAGGSSPQSCQACGGSGRKHDSQGSISPCSQCQGRGFTVDQPCPSCQAGRIETSSSQEIAVPPGVWNGYRWTENFAGSSADIVVTVSSSPVFTRQLQDPENLYLTVPISYPEAVLGAKVTIPTPEKIVGLKIPPGTVSGKKFKISGQGMPVITDPQRRGDLLVSAEIIVPQQLSAKQQRIIAELNKLDQGAQLRQELFQQLN